MCTCWRCVLESLLACLAAAANAAAALRAGIFARVLGGGGECRRGVACWNLCSRAWRRRRMPPRRCVLESLLACLAAAANAAAALRAGIFARVLGGGGECRRGVAYTNLCSRAWRRRRMPPRRCVHKSLLACLAAAANAAAALRTQILARVLGGGGECRRGVAYTNLCSRAWRRRRMLVSRTQIFAAAANAAAALRTQIFARVHKSLLACISLFSRAWRRRRMPPRRCVHKSLLACTSLCSRAWRRRRCMQHKMQKNLTNFSKNSSSAHRPGLDRHI